MRALLPHGTLLITLVLPLAVLAGTELTDDNFFAEVVLSGKWSFVKFFATWCGHCKRLKPDWDALADELAGSPHTLVAAVDCTGAGAGLCDKLDVSSYPTLKHFAPGSYKGEDYTGTRDLPALRQFALSELGPQCTADAMHRCSDEERQQLTAYLAMSPARRAAKVAKLRNEIKRAEEEHLTMRRDLMAHATGRWDASKAKLNELKADVARRVKLLRAAEPVEAQAELRREDAVAEEAARERARQKQLAAKARVEGARAKREASREQTAAASAGKEELAEVFW